MDSTTESIEIGKKLARAARRATRGKCGGRKGKRSSHDFYLQFYEGHDIAVGDGCSTTEYVDALVSAGVLKPQYRDGLYHSLRRRAKKKRSEVKELIEKRIAEGKA